VAGQGILFSLLTGRPLAYSSDVEPVQAIIAAIPYLALAIAGAGRMRPWLVGLSLTLFLWGFLLYDGVSAQWHPDGSGANIGLGLIMLASPFFITPIVLGVHAAQQRALARQPSIDGPPSASL
jgi:hypothetical protein